MWLAVLGSLAAGVFAFVKFAPEHIKEAVMGAVEPIIGGAVALFDKGAAWFQRVTARDHGDLGFERLQASREADEGLYAAP